MMYVTRNKAQRLYLRVSAETFCFAVYHPFGGCLPVIENYEVNPTASLNVNMREALASIPLAQETYGSTEVLLNVPYTLVPLERFNEDDIEDIYRFNFHGAGNDRIFYDVTGTMGAVLIYGMDEVFCRVVDDKFKEVHYRATITAVANRFAEEARRSPLSQLFVYCHEHLTDIFVFQSGKLLLGNRYVTRNANDSVYFILLAAETLGLDVLATEFNVVETRKDKSDLAKQLRNFVKKVNISDVVSTFGQQSSVTSVDMPYDLTAYLMQPY